MALIDDVKDYLGITWVDDALDRKLALAIQRGQALITRYAGTYQDFDDPESAAQGLLFDYLRYVRSEATELFEQNFQHELINLRLAAELSALEASDAAN